MTSPLRWTSLIFLINAAGGEKDGAFAEGESTREEIKNKLRQNFDGKIVRKDLTKKIKESMGVRSCRRE